MSQINWRNVSGANFNDPSAGIATANSLLQQGLEKIRGGVNFSAGREREEANNAFRRQLLSYTDHEALGAALQADPSLGLGEKAAGLLSDETLNLALNRRSKVAGTNRDILGIDQGKVNLESSEIDLQQQIEARDFSKKERDFIEKNQSVLNQATIIARSQGADKAQAYMVEKGLGDEASVATFNRLLNSATSAANSSLGSRSSLQNYNSGLQRAEIDTKATTLAEAILLQAGTEEGALQILNQSDEDPAVKAATRAKLRLPGLISSAALGGGGGSGGGGAPLGPGAKGDPYNVVFGFGKYGKPPKPLTEMTMGEVFQFGRNTLIPNTKGKISTPGKGTSASGAYQFVGTTMRKYGKKLYGDAWETTKFTPEVQDRLAEALFNDVKHTNLKTTWESLPDTRPGAYANKSWPEMRKILIENEIGAGYVGEEAVNETLINAGAAERTNELSDPLFKGHFDTIGFTGNTFEAVRNLTKSNPAFAGIPETRLKTEVDNIITKAREMGIKGMNPAQAANILENSFVPQGFIDNFWPSTLTIGTDAFGDDQTLSSSLVEDNLKRLKNGGQNTSLVGQANIQANQQARAQLTQQRNAAQQKVTFLQNRGIRGYELQRALQELAAADSALRNQRGAQLNDRKQTSFPGEGRVRRLPNQNGVTADFNRLVRQAAGKTGRSGNGPRKAPLRRPAPSLPGSNNITQQYLDLFKK